MNIDKKLEAARSVAWSAGSAARSAAWSAGSAWSVARSAARSAGSAEKKKQLQIIKEMLC